MSLSVECPRPVWSELCHTDKEVAIAYYNAVCTFVTAVVGTGTGGQVVVDRGGAGSQRNDGYGGGTQGVGAGRISSGGVEHCGVDGVASVGHAQGAVHAVGGIVGGDEHCGGTKATGGMAVGRGFGIGGRVVSLNLERGPNYERNQANRARKKAIKAAQRAGIPLAGETVARVERDDHGDTGRVGHFSGLESEVQDKLVRTRAERLILENEEKIMEFKDRAARRRSGLHHATEAVKVAKMADNWRKCADSDGPGQKVYGWARTIATTSSESIARDSPVNSLASLDSKISSKSSVSVADHTLTLGNLPMNGFEHYLSRYCGKSAGQLVNARRKFGGALRAEDCLTNVKDSPVPQSQIINYLNEVIDDFAMRYERCD